MKHIRLIILLGFIAVLGGGYLLLNTDQNQSTKVSNDNNLDSSTSLTFNPPKDCDKPTTLSAEGPYYKQGSPQRINLVAENSGGELLIITGFVFDDDCQPVASAWLDFWQADENGEYDNVGYKLRGYQFTDDDGKYFLETIVPKRYSGRPPHIHVKVRKNQQSETITSQLYFPDVPKLCYIVCIDM